MEDEMSKIVLEVEDSKLEQLMAIIGAIKSDIITSYEVHPLDLDNDPMAQELKRRIQEIDDGTMPLTPFQDGMDKMMERMRVKYASA